MQEVWKDIQGYEGLYQVSNLGRVISIRKNRTNTPVQLKDQPIIMKLSLSSSGYCHVQLYKDGEYKTHNVHRLVANTFIPNPDKKPEVNHIDANKTNNSVSNLEWVTRMENLHHAASLGLTPPSPMLGKYGENNPNSKPILQYDANGCFIKEWDSIMSIARHYSCNNSMISACVNGRVKTSLGYIWKEKTNNYPLKISPPTRKYNNYKSKPVVQVSNDGTIVNEWRSISDASQKTGLSRYKISLCCQGTIPSLQGYKFRYSE